MGVAISKQSDHPLIRVNKNSKCLKQKNIINSLFSSHFSEDKYQLVSVSSNAIQDVPRTTSGLEWVSNYKNIPLLISQRFPDKDVAK